MPLGTNRRRIAVRGALATALIVLGVGIVPAMSASAAAPAPVVIDDFNGQTAGTRTVTTMPLPNTSTTPAATFTQSGGLGLMSMTGSGNGIGGVQLSYALPTIDLTSGGSNTQFFLTFPLIHRTGTPEPSTAANISVQLTGGGITGTYGTSIGNTTNFNIVLNFSCSVNPVCFTPQPDFTKVTNVTVTISYPQNYSSDTTTVQLDSIKTSPTGGAVPDPAMPTITSPADPSYGPSGTLLSFPVQFTSAGQPVTVYSVATGGALGHGDVTVGGTAAGVSSYAVTGSGSQYTVTVGPLTGDGTVTVALAAGVAKDAWGQPTDASSVASVQFAIPVRPSISGAPPVGTVGVPYSYTFAAKGTPTPTFSVSGTLPSGLTLASDGTLAGTPAAGTGGSYPITVTAQNLAGSDPIDVTLVVQQKPAFTSLGHATFRVGQAGSFTVTTTGLPTSALTLASGALPAGLSFTDNSNGTATIAGTPTGPGGTGQVTLSAANLAGTVTQVLTVEVDQAPAFTSADHAGFVVGQAGTFTVAASGFPVPALSVTGTVPAGLAFVDNRDGTATLSGTPTGAGGTAVLTVSATNAVASPTQLLTVQVDQVPAFTSADHAVFVVGQAGTFTVSADGVPTPALTVSGALPAGLTFRDNGDGTATIAGTATGSGGATQVTVTATNRVTSVTQLLTLQVDQAPAFTSADHASFVVGNAGTFTVQVDGVPVPTLAVVGTVPAGLTFVDNGDGTATLSGTPTGSGGSVQLTVSATNSVTSVTQLLTVQVDQAPAFTSADHALFVVGQPGTFTVAATGVPTPALTVSGVLPAGLTFTDNGDGTATLTGTPTGSGGTVQVAVSATNSVTSVPQTLTVEVDRAPAFTSANHAGFVVGQSGRFTVAATGFPVPALSVTGTLPAGLAFVDNGDGTATVSGTPTGSGGTVPVTVWAANSVTSTGQLLTVQIDQAPAFTSADHALFVVGQMGTFTVAATGVPTPALTVSGVLPAGLTFTDNGDGTATLTGTPTGSGGTVQVTVSATNTVTSVLQTLTVEVDQAPAITSADHAAFVVGQSGTFTVETSGFPAPALAVAGAVPAGLTFTDNGDGTATLAGTPTGSGGTVPVTISATNSVTSATQLLTVAVDVTPVLTSADHAVFVIGQAGSFTVTATGLPTPVLTVAGTLPAGLTFTDAGDGTATLSGTPTGPGDQSVVVTATSAALSVDQTLAVKVKQVPAFTSTGSASFQIGVAGSFTVTATGIPTPTLALSGTLPAGLAFVDNGDGTATISGTPRAGVAGSYNVTVNATNDLTDPAQTLVVVVAPAVSTGDGVLAITGTPADALLAAAGLLVAAGAAFTVVARGRRRTVRG